MLLAGSILLWVVILQTVADGVIMFEGQKAITFSSK